MRIQDIGIPLSHRLLQRDGASHRLDRTRELYPLGPEKIAGLPQIDLARTEISANISSAVQASL